MPERITLNTTLEVDTLNVDKNDMPPSWLRHLGEHGGSPKLPVELEHANWSRGLGAAGNSAFSEGLLSASNIALHGEVCAIAVEPVLGYLAVGTENGTIHLFGTPAVQITWTLRPANKVRHLLFKSGSPLLIAIGEYI
jgi:syntaxin-binding protein 5